MSFSSDNPGSHAQVTIFNDTGIENSRIQQALMNGDQMGRNVAQLLQWAVNMQPRSGGILQRDRYLADPYLFRQFETARYAIETDNIVSGVADTTEQLAFNEVRIKCDDPDQEDVWGQIAKDIKLVQRMQEIFREMFTYSNCNVGVRFGKKNYSPGGKTEKGQARRKVFKNLNVPNGITVLDVVRIVPVGDFLFGDERLVYIADPSQIGRFMQSFTDPETSDDIATAQLLEAPYPSNPFERRQIMTDTGAVVTPENMFLMNKDRVFRITATRSSYERFAHCRMLSLFELLDLKQQLRQMDRALLIGGTQFILLVKKGSELDPPVPAELNALSAQFQNMARVPVIIDDHRLSIEIITPKTDHVLAPERHRLLDSMIAIRLFQIFQQAGNSRESGDDSTKLIRVVARSMEARRDLIRDTFMEKIIMPTFEMNDELTEMPRIEFYPNRISLDFDPNIITTFLDLRGMDEISSDSTLAQFGLNVADEQKKIKMEREQYGLIPPMEASIQIPDVGTTGGGSKVPTPTPTPTVTKPAAGKPSGKTGGTQPANKTAGRRGGGNSNGGGANRDSMRSGPPRGAGKGS